MPVLYSVYRYSCEHFYGAVFGLLTSNLIGAWQLINGWLGHKKTFLSGWPATQEADLQGGAIHLRPLPRHRTLPGAVH